MHNSVYAKPAWENARPRTAGCTAQYYSAPFHTCRSRTLRPLTRRCAPARASCR